MNEKVINRIEKLFVHAESAESIGSQAEAEAFAAKARALMVEHKLEIADLDLSGEAKSASEPESFYVEATEWGDRKKRRAISWRRNLAWKLSPAYFCKVLGCSGRTNSLYIIGAEEDKNAFLRGFQTLLKVAEDLADAAYDEHKSMWGSDRTWKISWYDGFVAGVDERVQRELREEKQNLDEHALVVVKDQMTKVEGAVKKFHPRTVSSKQSRSRHHSDAYAAGRRAGRQKHNNRLK
jgi:hypothetical protein